MPPFKLPDHKDRAKLAADTRAAALAKFKERAAPDPAVLAERAAIKEAQEAKRLEKLAASKALREAREVEAERAKAEKAAAAAKAKAEAEMTAIQRLAMQKAARDARYAARKQKK